MVCAMEENFDEHAREYKPVCVAQRRREHSNLYLAMCFNLKIEAVAAANGLRNGRKLM